MVELADKACPDCAETVKGAARVCRYCGHKFDSAPPERQHEQPVAPELPLVGAVRAASRDHMVAWAAISLLLMLIGSFGPWVKALGTSVSGTDGGNDGWVVVGVALLAGLLVYGGRTTRGGAGSALIGGILGAAITIHDRSHVSSAIAHAGAFAQALVHVGWGLNLAMVGSISLAICGLVWLIAGNGQAAADATDSARTAAQPYGDGPPTIRFDPEKNAWVRVYSSAEASGVEASSAAPAPPVADG